MPGYCSSMRAVWLDVPEAFLAERHRLGNDKLDELWEGVLHMVPPSSLGNARITTDFVVALTPIAARRGLQVWTDGTGLFDAPKNYRIADRGCRSPVLGITLTIVRGPKLRLVDGPYTAEV